LAVLLVGAPCCAEFAQSVSDATKPAVALAVAAAFFHESDANTADAARVGDAILLSYGLAETLKPNLTVNESRWNHSFPSGHSAIAFAAASSLAKVYPHHKWFYYAAAGLIGWSRVELGVHTWGDVAGGAALGIALGNWSMSSSDGLMFGRAFRF
jgi:membrane-associated phospholipid phosphatase